MRKISNNDINKMFKNDIFDGCQRYISEIINNGYFDSHNVSQTFYIDNYVEGKNTEYTRNINNINYFILMDDLNKDLSKLFKKEIVLSSMNQSAITPLIKQKLKDVINEQKEKIEIYYEKDIKLKQGFYNYKYVLVNAQGELEEGVISGDYYETENNYKVLVYYRDLGARYDRIVGYGEGTSTQIGN